MKEFTKAQLNRLYKRLVTASNQDINAVKIERRDFITDILLQYMSINSFEQECLKEVGKTQITTDIFTISYYGFRDFIEDMTEYSITWEKDVLLNKLKSTELFDSEIPINTMLWMITEAELYCKYAIPISEKEFLKLFDSFIEYATILVNDDYNIVYTIKGIDDEIDVCLRYDRESQTVQTKTIHAKKSINDWILGENRNGSIGDNFICVSDNYSNSIYKGNVYTLCIDVITPYLHKYDDSDYYKYINPINNSSFKPITLITPITK